MSSESGTRALHPVLGMTNVIGTPSEPRLIKPTSTQPLPLHANPTPHLDLSGPRVLRVGVIHEELLVAERHLRPDEANPVVVGNEVGSTVRTPWETGIHRLPLFQHRGGKWHLRIGAEVVGVLNREGKTHDLAAIRRQALAKGADPKNDILVPLDDSASGRLKFRETRILFQFAHPPIVAPRPSFARRAKTAFRGLDLVWWNFLLLMVLVQGVGMVGLQLSYDPPVDDAGFLSVPNVKMFVPEKPPEVSKKDDQAPDEKSPEAEKPAEPEKADEKPKNTPEKPLDQTARKAQIQQKLSKTTIIRYLAAVTEGDNNNLVSNEQVGARLAAAWDGTPGVIGDVGETRSGARYAENGLDPGKVAGLDQAELGDSTSAAVDTGTSKEVKVRGRVSASSAEDVFGSGNLDKGAISGVVQRRLGAIKSCYERELKGNPALAGKIVLQFTIQESGRVGDVKIVSDSTGEPNVAKCMVTQISHFRFPSPQGGSVTASYPFVLQPGT